MALTGDMSLRKRRSEPVGWDCRCGRRGWCSSWVRSTAGSGLSGCAPAAVSRQGAAGRGWSERRGGQARRDVEPSTLDQGRVKLDREIRAARSVNDDVSRTSRL